MHSRKPRPLGVVRAGGSAVKIETNSFFRLAIDPPLGVASQSLVLWARILYFS